MARRVHRKFNLSRKIIKPSNGAEGVVLFRVMEILPNHVLPHLTSSSST